MKNKIGTKENPTALKMPPLSSDYTVHFYVKDGKDILVCTVGKTSFAPRWREYAAHAKRVEYSRPTYLHAYRVASRQLSGVSYLEMTSR
jgi:hypothetical protein